MSPRNVLLVFTEDHGAQLGAYGTPAAQTPNIDALAVAGTLYRSASITFATCTGSKSAIMTGRHNHAIGVIGNVQEYVGSYEQLATENPPWLTDPTSAYNRHKIRAGVPTLIEVLDANGYFLGVQNKLHMAPHDKFPFDLWYRDNGRPYEQVTDFIAQAQASGRPWLLQHVVQASHRPYPNADTTPLQIDTDAIELPAHLPDTTVSRQDWAEYLQAVRVADRNVGRVLDALRDAGEAERTLVIVMGDHGPSYHRAKYSTYGFGLRVPLVFAGPGVGRDVIRDELFSGVDLMPTVLELLGLPLPQGLHGVSHAPLLGRPGAFAGRQHVVGETRADRSISDGRYRLIYAPDARDTFMPEDNRDFVPWRNRVYRHIVENRNDPAFAQYYRLLDLADRELTAFDRPRFELFDAATDPWEVDDLADRPEHADTRERLKSALRSWMDATGDPSPRP